MPFYFRKECPLNSGYLKYHIAEARYWRKAGDKSKKQLCLWQAQRERMNEREFLSSPSELPF
nr:hypothetical protein [Escherichia coli]